MRAEDILCDSRLKIMLNPNLDDVSLKVLSFLRFELKKNFFGKKKSALSILYKECGVGFCCLGLISTSWLEIQ